jgi:hypothetical protein
MRIAVAASASALLILIGAAFVGAADRYRGPTTRPSSVPTPSAILVDFSGLMEFRSNDYGPWQKPERGAQIPFTGEIRLGPRGAVQLKFDGTDRIIIVDRLGKSEIRKIWQWSTSYPDKGAYERDDVDPELRYGHTRHDIGSWLIPVPGLPPLPAAATAPPGPASRSAASTRPAQ